MPRVLVILPYIAVDPAAVAIRRPGHFFYIAMTPPDTKTIRDLMLTIELIRSHFEHEENLSESDQLILDIATDRNAACAEYIPDYQQPSFWDDVTRILAS